MSAVADIELYVVNDNITKESAYLANKAGNLTRVAQGVYLPAEISLAEAFKTYGMRMAKKFFPEAVLTHSTAWYLGPVDDRIFLGGDYPYKKTLTDLMADGEIYEARIVQSLVRPNIADRRLYEEVTITDPMGPMKFMRATLELQILQQMEATKVNPEKHVSESEVLKMWVRLIEKYDGRGHAWDVIEKVAVAADKTREANRFLRDFYSETL